MEAIADDVLVQVQSLINLQLAGAAINQGGMLSVKQLYTNMRRFVDLDISFTEFIECLDRSRDELGIRDGEIGVDVNYISMKKD